RKRGRTDFPANRKIGSTPFLPSESEPIRERLLVIAQVELVHDALLAQPVVLAAELAVPAAELRRARDERHAPLGRRLAARGLRRDLAELALDVLLRPQVARDLVVDRAQRRLELVEVPAAVVRRDEVG